MVSKKNKKFKKPLSYSKFNNTPQSMNYKKPDSIPNCISCGSDNVFEGHEGLAIAYYCKSCNHVFLREEMEEYKNE